MITNVQMFETNQSFTAQLIGTDCDFKVDFTIDDMLIHTTFKDEVS